MTLDDLGRAVVAKSNEHEGDCISWDDQGEDEKNCLRVCLLAAVERFAEEVAKLTCTLCEEGKPLVLDGDRVCHSAEGLMIHCHAWELNRLLSSLRAEAGQGQMKGSA